MVDVDVVKLLPIAHENFQQKFKLPGILPGGSHCMMSAVSGVQLFRGPSLAVSNSSHVNPYPTAYLLPLPKVNANGRPFMGPNLYLTPPASFTHFHQDGHVRYIAWRCINQIFFQVLTLLACLLFTLYRELSTLVIYVSRATTRW